MTKPSSQEIIAKAEELYWDDDNAFDYIGVRTQEQEFELGTIDHTSKVWIDGEETDEELDGLCVTDYENPAVKAHGSDRSGSCYFGDHVALIGYNYGSDGEDDGEIIARDPEVIYIFC